ncbi:hypothetical protein [Oceaniovalibus guishaninsula]|nr:hypothetical protein [Oceaniovalibus guishaninsula]
MKRFAAALAAGLAAQAVWADSPFDGLWRAAPTSDCGAVGQPGGAIRIEGDKLSGAGTTCRMTAPVDVRGMEAVLYDMICEGGGGTGRAFFATADDGGLILVWDGLAFKYTSCADTAAGIVTTADDIGITD